MWMITITIRYSCDVLVSQPGVHGEKERYCMHGYQTLLQLPLFGIHH